MKNIRDNCQYVGEATKDFERMAEEYDIEHEGEKIMGIKLLPTLGVCLNHRFQKDFLRRCLI